MERKEIVARFLKEGHQLDASVLDYFMTNPERVEEFIGGFHAVEQPPIITLDLVRSVLKEKKQPPGVKIIKKFFGMQKVGKISISDYSKRFVNNYEVKKQMLMGRVDSTKLLSINKIQKQKEFVLICAIREMDVVEKSAVVEDLTGNTVVYFENTDEFENLIEDDVAAVLCEASAGGIKAKRIVWPDIPLKRTASKTKERVYCLFISDFHMDSAEFNKERYEKFVKWIVGINKSPDYEKIYVFILGGVSQNKADVVKLLDALPKRAFKIFLKSKKDAAIEREDLLSADKAAMLKIEGIKFLLCQGDELYKYKQVWKGGAKDIMTNLLKRRDLSPLRDAEPMLTALEDTIVTQVPDIFASGSFHSPITTNYKGVSIITTGSLTSSGQPVFWAADLKTREINKVDLS